MSCFSLFRKVATHSPPPSSWVVQPSLAHSSVLSFHTTAYTSSKLGAQPLKYPLDVQIQVLPFLPTLSFPTAKLQVHVTGPRGSLSMPLLPFVKFETPELLEQGAPKKVLQVKVDNPLDKKQRAMWGTTRRLLENMVIGVSDGFTVPIRMNGVGYRALFEEGKLSLKLGYCHPILMEIPKGVEVSIPAPQRILLQGNNLAQITQFAAEIRNWRKPEPYKQKGVFVGDETIKKKEGKKR